MSGINLDELADIAIVDTGGDELAIAADGSIAVTDNGGSLTVDATDFDIRDLINTQDSVAIGDEVDLVDMQLIGAAFDATPQAFPIAGVRQDAGGAFAGVDDGDSAPLMFNATGELRVAADLTSSVADDAADSGNPIKVGGRGVSGVLTALSATGDRYDLLGDLYRRTWINDSANIGLASTAETVGTSVAEVVSSPLAGRRFVTIQNEGTADVFVGAAAITTSTGVKISKKSSATMQWGEDIDIFMISGSAGQDVRVLESA